MNFPPPDVLNPDSLAVVLARSCTVAPSTKDYDTDALRRLVELLVMYIPLDHYEALLREWGTDPVGREIYKVVAKYVENGQ